MTLAAQGVYKNLLPKKVTVSFLRHRGNILLVESTSAKLGSTDDSVCFFDVKRLFFVSGRKWRNYHHDHVRVDHDHRLLLPPYRTITKTRGAFSTHSSNHEAKSKSKIIHCCHLVPQLLGLVDNPSANHYNISYLLFLQYQPWDERPTCYFIELAFLSTLVLEINNPHNQTNASSPFRFVSFHSFVHPIISAILLDLALKTK